ncbi:MAG: PDGLE domain-containing protein [Methanoregula sp.]|jgi:cobalt/nickel transport protein|uniref:PDGLE domain-containing protein n=1 Tax=Methanoregula sp. TaxID=2052170 RepID=UPI003C1F67E9
MDQKNLKFLVIGVLLALVVAIVAVFLASPNPDGLDSTALIASGQKTLTAPATGENISVEAPGHFTYASPMPDYSLGGKWGPMGGIIAMVTGTILVFAIVIGLAWLLKKRKMSKKQIS